MTDTASRNPKLNGTQFAELSAFVAVADLRHFTKAAAHLGVATSTLSKTIRSLEERLGIRLLNRTTRSVGLTDAGELLLAQMQPVLDGMQQAVQAINVFRDKPMGMLRLAVARYAAPVISPVLRDFLSAYPAIGLEISLDDSDTDIVSERFDAGVRIEERIARDMIAVRISDRFRMIPVAAPDYIARHPEPRAPEDLEAHNCIRYRDPWDGALLPWEFEKSGRRLAIAVTGSFIVNDMEMAGQAAIDGIGIALRSECWALPFIAQGRLVPLLSDWCPSQSGFFLYYSSRRQIPFTLQAFVNFIRKASQSRCTKTSPKNGSSLSLG
jgi:DNA-binding transcriptional LysR family regulator